MLPEDHDPTNLARALELTRDDRFALGVIYRRPVEPVVAAAHGEGVWRPEAVASGEDLPAE
jgi:hypothetical protein